MFHVVLFEPEIPPNTGNIIRLCANTGASLHLIKPLGFSFEDKSLRRAGLDYREYAPVTQHDSLAEFKETVNPERLFALSTRGTKTYSTVDYRSDDAFLFGPETRGLSAKLLRDLGPDQVLKIPMRPDNRSLNLSNAVAVVVYHAWQQLAFE